MTRRTFQHQPKEVRKSSLVEAALDAVADEGLSGATVREVAERASVTPGLIRKYFMSKDNLIQAAYKSFVDDLVEKTVTQIGNGSTEERLRQLVEATCQLPFTDKRTISIWAAFIGMTHDDPEMLEIHRQGYQAFRDVIASIIESFYKERGTVQPSEVIRLKAIAVNAVLDGFWLEVALSPEVFDEIDVVQLVHESIIAILGSTPENVRVIS